jgi:hypothetical protein
VFACELHDVDTFLLKFLDGLITRYSEIIYVSAVGD